MYTRYTHYHLNAVIGNLLLFIYISKQTGVPVPYQLYRNNKIKAC